MEGEDILDKEFLEKINSMSEDEKENFLFSLPREKAASYKEIFMRITMLEEFYYIISDTNLDFFKNKFNLAIKKVGDNPANILKDYIVLEIKKFYELANEQKNRFNLPNAPPYWKKLKNLRDTRIAHPDTKNKTNREVAELYKTIDKIGLDNIFEDFKKYAEQCISLVNKSEFYDEGLWNLRKLMKEGKIRLLDDSKLKKSLKKVKIRPDGSVIESTLDGTIRALILAIRASEADGKDFQG